MKISTLIFLLTTASALMFLPVLDTNSAAAQSAGSFFTPLSGGSVSGGAGNSSQSNTSSAASASVLFGTSPATGFFVPTNTSFTTVSTTTASGNITNGNITCSGAACVNVSPSCPLSLIFTRDAKLGDTGIDVVALQKHLESLGLLIIPVGTTYGQFGGKTQAALTLYQATVGLQTTGFLDVMTRAALNSKVFQGNACYTYIRYDSLQFLVATKALRQTVALDLNKLGITAAGNRKFCAVTPGSFASNSCFNINTADAFIGYLPNKVSAVKSALYLATFPSRFKKVDYVPSDPQTALGSIVVLYKATNTVTTYTTTTYSPDNGTTTTSTSTQSTVIR